jgi:hypothetical protein
MDHESTSSRQLLQVEQQADHVLAQTAHQVDGIRKEFADQQHALVHTQTREQAIQRHALEMAHEAQSAWAHANTALAQAHDQDHAMAAFQQQFKQQEQMRDMQHRHELTLYEEAATRARLALTNEYEIQVYSSRRETQELKQSLTACEQRLAALTTTEAAQMLQYRKTIDEMSKQLESASTHAAQQQQQRKSAVASELHQTRMREEMLATWSSSQQMQIEALTAKVLSLSSNKCSFGFTLQLNSSPAERARSSRATNSWATCLPCRAEPCLAMPALQHP